MCRGRITPEEVAKWITFEGGNPTWKYKSLVRGMPEKQAEGVAYLWNLLSKRRVAILADEVGMGKTYQAIGLLCLLWSARPGARVLVMTPNRDICTHWELEYGTFLKNHWREAICDDSATPADHGFPFIERCSNLNELRDRVAADTTSPNARTGKFYLTTIHSLSTLTLHDDGDHCTLAARRAQALREAIQSHLQGGFDLVIVDEAHYLRRSDGDSQRAYAARAFFGPLDAQLGKQVLLLTATPSHSGLADVSNILGYFTDTANKSAGDLLKRHALRRLRLMKGKDGAFHNKHHYRHETVLPADFKHHPESEFFFALYQRGLVTQQKQKKIGRHLFYGYLEGFESTGIDSELAQSRLPSKESSKQDTEGAKIAFHEAPDSRLLRDLSRKFYATTGKYPSHPKYDVLVRDLVNEALFQTDRKSELHDDKHLVFVRRIPSVREMTKRVNHAYDEVFAQRILKAWAVKPNDPWAKRLKDRRWDRRTFASFVNSLRKKAGNTPNSDEIKDDLSEAQVQENREDRFDDEALGSRIMNLFVTRKANMPQPHSTDCSNVRLRFRKPESLFSLFLEPACDYCTGGYTYYFKGADKTGKKDDYANAAREGRRQQTKTNLEGQAPNVEPYEQEMGTAWALMYKRLSDSEKQKLATWQRRNVNILENFARYLKAGFLFASPVMIELYCWFTEFQHTTRGRGTSKAQQRYRSFLRFMDTRIDDSLMLLYFRDALGSFDRLCEKLVRQKLASEDEDWAKLASQHSPAWLASGESSNRDRLILGFNSPFFPNVLVATSVFQEGVNLHLHCRQVHHYGIAWTPGDNEQRVGRLDRLFGRVNMELERNGRTQLRIQYPYLAESFDEDQLASFLQKKHAVEKEMDDCLQTNFDKTIDMAGVASDWQQYLKMPMEQEVEDPYPPQFYNPLLMNSPP